MRRLLRLLPFLLLSVLIIGSLTYLARERPDVVQRVMIKLDVFGLSETTRNENDRLQKINSLQITYEEKQVLTNRTVFMDASPEMVKLALGDPKKTLERTLEDKRVVVYLIYYLPDDKRPTILVFLSGKLVKAYKGSALDF